MTSKAKKVTVSQRLTTRPLLHHEQKHNESFMIQVFPLTHIHTLALTTRPLLHYEQKHNESFMIQVFPLTHVHTLALMHILTSDVHTLVDAT